jgi:hypothetical protein
MAVISKNGAATTTYLELNWCEIFMLEAKISSQAAAPKRYNFSFHPTGRNLSNNPKDCSRGSGLRLIIILKQFKNTLAKSQKPRN